MLARARAHLSNSRRCIIHRPRARDERRRRRICWVAPGHCRFLRCARHSKKRRRSWLALLFVSRYKYGMVSFHVSKPAGLETRGQRRRALGKRGVEKHAYGTIEKSILEEREGGRERDTIRTKWES